MQAIIMAAGMGSRLGEVTNGLPKSFLEVRGRKLIEYNIDMLKQYGINDIVIVIGYMCDMFEKLIDKKRGIKLVFNPFYETTNVIPSFWFGQQKLKDDFIYINADTICDPSIFEELLAAEGDIVLAVDFKECDKEAMKVRIKDREIVEINKTMKPDTADGESIGILKVSKRCLFNLKNITNNMMKEKKFSCFFPAAIQEIIDRQLHKVTFIQTKGRFWCEIDCLEDYIRAEENISENLIKLPRRFKRK